MPGERDLTTLLEKMEPRVHPETFVFCCFADFCVPPGIEAVGTFREAEGLTAIVPKRQAEAIGLSFHFESTMVTLAVHSALDSVGFLARISAALAARGIACNVVSGYYHDHLFVAPDKAAEALQALSALSLPR